LAFAHDPTRGKKGGKAKHGHSYPPVPWGLAGGGGSRLHRERVWRIEDWLKPPLLSCPPLILLHCLWECGVAGFSFVESVDLL
jgi:hypothetical protein